MRTASERAFDALLMKHSRSPRPAIREDVRDAVIDALQLKRYVPDAQSPPVHLMAHYEAWNALGISDPVTLPPWNMRF